jgi:hypothetical protein
MLNYGFTEGRRGSLIRTEIDVRSYGSIAAQDANFTRNLRKAIEYGVIWRHELSPSSIALSYDFASARRKRLPARRETALHVITASLASVCNFALSDDEPKLDVWIGSERHGIAGRLGMEADVRWPQMDDKKLSQLATHKMLQTAVALGYAQDRPLAGKMGLIYAEVDRSRGVTLQTNPIGSCSVDTDGMWYKPEDPVIKLLQHNLYNSDQQFIILAGAIAIAHAEELVANP